MSGRELDGSAWSAPAAAPHTPIVARGEPPRVLLLAALRWPLAARLATAFRALDCAVHAWCPSGHPLVRTSALARRHRASTLAPLRSLRAAIDAAAPDLIVPCDDAAASALARLHRTLDRDGDPDRARRALIERSIGHPASCALASARARLMALAEAHGVRVPPTATVDDERALDAWAAQHGFPAVLKTDGSWGGLGVAVVRDLDAARAAYRRMRRVRAWPAISDFLLRRDATPLLRYASGARARVSIQRFVAGRAANRAVACWNGEVLAGISVCALRTLNALGPATVVRRIEHADMDEAARRLVRALGSSGLVGFDFVLEAATGLPYLIEVNPRATPICHLPFGAGHDLPSALRARIRADGAALASADTLKADVVAMFPGEWRRNRLSPFLRHAHHDVPWTEPELVRDCLDRPWEDRGLVARLRAWLKPRRAPRDAWPELVETE